MEKYGVKADWSAESVALHTQVVLQGALVLAMAKGGGAFAANSVDHLRRYLKLPFSPEKPERQS